MTDVEQDRAHWGCQSPFNLKFSSQKMTAEQRASLRGSGIYFITKLPEEEVVYLGLFRPVADDIVSLRWGRHLQTITWRGAKIGLGPDKKRRNAETIRQRRDDLLAVATHQGLRDVIQAAYENDDAKLYNSTGYDTTANRLRFANEHWDVFREDTSGSILDHLEIRLMCTRPAVDGQTAADEVEAIETAVLKLYKPICNKHYKHQLHSATRSRNTVPAIIGAVNEAMSEWTGSIATRLVSLTPRAPAREPCR